MLYQNLLILIGVTLTASQSLNNQVAEKEIQKLVNSLQLNGNVANRHGIHKPHHGKHHEKSRHDIDRNVMNIQTLNLIFKHNNMRRKDPDLTIAEDQDAAEVNRMMCAITGSQGCGGNDGQNAIRSDNSIDPVDKYDIDRTDREEDEKYEEEAKNDIVVLLNDLEKKLLRDEDKNLRNKELRCRGNRCGKHRDDNDDDDDDDRRNDDRNEELRCSGNRCGKHRDDDDDHDRRNDDRNEELRCRGNRCGKHRADNDDDRRDEDENKELRCRGNRCGRGRSRDTNIDSYFKFALEKYGKRYKINKDLDAIVLDVNSLDGILQTLNKEDEDNNVSGDIIMKDRYDVDSNNLNSDITVKDKYNKNNANSHKIHKQNLDSNKRYKQSRDDKLKYRWNQGTSEDYMNELSKGNLGWDTKAVADKDHLFVSKSLSELLNPTLGNYRLRSLLPLTLKQKVKRKLVTLNKNKVQVPFELKVNGLGQLNSK